MLTRLFCSTRAALAHTEDAGRRPSAGAAGAVCKARAGLLLRCCCHVTSWQDKCKMRTLAQGRSKHIGTDSRLGCMPATHTQPHSTSRHNTTATNQHDQNKRPQHTGVVGAGKGRATAHPGSERPYNPASTAIQTPPDGAVCRAADQLMMHCCKRTGTVWPSIQGTSWAAWVVIPASHASWQSTDGQMQRCLLLPAMS